MTAWATCSGSMPIAVQVSWGQGAQLDREVGHKHQLTRLAFGAAGEQLIDQAAGRLGNIWVQQRGRADDQDRAGLGLACGSWRQEQAEVAVADPAGLQRLAERVRAELVSAHIPPSSQCSWEQATGSTRSLD